MTRITIAALLGLLAIPAGARDLTQADVRYAWHQASLRQQMRVIRSTFDDHRRTVLRPCGR